MPGTREQLLVSTFWSILRPKFALTPGHFLLRLNDASIALGNESAADLLRCYGHLRRALAQLAGATSAQLYTALDWQPVGDAIGEPLPDASTATIQVFFTWPENASGSPFSASPTPAASLRLPAHQRIPVEPIDALDEQVRAWHGGRMAALPDQDIMRVAPNPVPGGAFADPGASLESEGWAERPFHIEPSHPGPGRPFRGGHWIAVPRFTRSPLDTLEPGELLELASTLERVATHARAPYRGTCMWALDYWQSPEPAKLHIFARQHGAEHPLLAEFVTGGGLDAAPAPALQGQSGGASHNVEK